MEEINIQTNIIIELNKTEINPNNKKNNIKTNTIETKTRKTKKRKKRKRKNIKICRPVLFISDSSDNELEEIELNINIY
jgi:hypothetical protein